ncbi:hypothetical protein SDC9_180906 [bioreactor metagenome]|uniref:Uncharacterized protein n=1 Tax=bioreactor metagenome TaxID=1076179 RepID=A0A645H5R8_9ZZZZ
MVGDFFNYIIHPYLHIFPHHNVGTEIHGQPHTESQSDLCHNFEFSFQSLFIFFEHLDIIICKAKHSQPYRTDEHQDDIDVFQLPEEQGRDKNGENNNDSPHGRCSALAVLSFQVEIANGFSDLFLLELPDDLLPDKYADQ